MRNSSLVAILVALCLIALATPAMAAKPGPSPFTTQVTGTNTLGQTFTGTLEITRFNVDQATGQLMAVGFLTGSLVDSTGVIATLTKERVRLPATLTEGSTCQILHLELGPIDLDLLGLVIHLDKVVLDITAEPGSGNLLGNLLCTIAGLLDNGGPLQTIADLLNRIIDLL